MEREDAKEKEGSLEGGSIGTGTASKGIKGQSNDLSVHEIKRRTDRDQSNGDL